MAQVFSGTIGVSLQGSITNDDSGNPQDPAQQILAAFRWAIATGTGAGMADRVLTKSGTIAAAATLTIDLAGGGLTDAFGVAVAPVKVKGLIVVNKGTGTLTVGGSANKCTIATGAQTLPPPSAATAPSVLAIWTSALAGWAVTGGSADEIALAATTADVLYELYVIGVSA